MNEATKVNLIDMLGEEKANFIFKQTEDSAKRKQESEYAKKAYIDRMEKAMIGKEYLIDGTYYNGHRFRGSHVGQWDAKSGVFLIIEHKFGLPSLQQVKHFSDVRETLEDGFIPLDKIEKRVI